MQRTIKNSTDCTGIGLHTGNRVHLRFCPGLPDSGVVFLRTDLPDSPPVPAGLEYVNDTRRGVSLKNGLAEVKTVEHVLSAAAGLRIDNLSIEVSAPELPAIDGSSQGFVELLKRAEIVCQDGCESRIPIKIQSPVWVSMGDSHLVVLPANDYSVSFVLHLENSFVGSQAASFSISPEVFEREIAPARTFGFLSEVEQLKSQGLAMGGSLENAVVIGENGFLNELRFKDELVRHKILDLIGDLSLVGRPIFGAVIAVRAGHKLNLMLARKIVDEGSQIRDFSQRRKERKEDKG